MNHRQQILARLDRIPIWPYPYGIIIAIGIGFFFAFFDIITIGLSIPILTKQFHITASYAIWSITSSLIGYIIGSFLDSRLSDFFGRRLALMLSMLFFSTGSILSATSPNMAWLIAWRFLIGMGIGSEIANVTTYMAELSPAALRGRITSIAVALAFIGFAAVPFVGLALIPNFDWGWRLLFVIGGIGGFVVLFARRFIPETIRWHVSQGNHQYAEKLLVKAEALASKRLGKKLLDVDPTTTPIVEDITASIKNLFIPPYLTRICLFAAIWFVYYTGNYGWLTLDTKLFLYFGFDLHNSLLLVSINSLGFVVGALFAIYFGDKFQRKHLLAITALIWALTLIVIAWLPSLMVILMIGFLATTTIAIFIPQMYTYTAEVFPTACRATGVSITDGIGHLGGAFCGQIIFAAIALFPTVNKAAAAFSVMAGTAIIASLLILLGPKMTGRHLQN